MDAHRKLKVGNVVLYSGRAERVPINQCVLCRVVKHFGDERPLKGETIQENCRKEFNRPTDQFSSLEIDDRNNNLLDRKEPEGGYESIRGVYIEHHEIYHRRKRTFRRSQRYQMGTCKPQ